MCFFFSHFFVAFVTCFGSLSCCKTSPQPIFSVLDERRRFSSKMLCHMAAQYSEGVLYPQEKNSQRNNVSTSLLYCGETFFRSFSAFLFFQAQRVKSILKSSILVSSERSTGSQTFSESFIKQVYICVFLSTKTGNISVHYNVVS